MSDTITENSPLIIADLPKNRRETVRISIKEFKGGKFLDIRVFFPGDDNELRPTGKGVTVKPELLSDLIAALQKAESEAKRLGLLKSGSS